MTFHPTIGDIVKYNGQKFLLKNIMDINAADGIHFIAELMPLSDCIQVDYNDLRKSFD